MAKVKSLQKKEAPSYNPQSKYKWEPTDLFEITGQQLALLYHCLTTDVHSIEGSTIAQKYQAYDVVMDVFKRGVAQGAIVESDVYPEAELINEGVNALFRK